MLAVVLDMVSLWHTGVTPVSSFEYAGLLSSTLNKRMKEMEFGQCLI